jgi:hypothetical protein
MDLTVHCLFHNYSDYECSAETLIGVFLTKEDAETALLELIARAEKLAAENMAFDQRIREFHERTRDRRNRPEFPFAELSKILEEQKAWRIENFGHDYSSIPDRTIDAYSIEEVEIGKLRS